MTQQSFGTSMRILKHENVFVVEAAAGDDWVPIGIFKHAGPAQSLAMSLAKAREVVDIPQNVPGVVVWESPPNA